jgi:hypothetical protein
MIQLNLLDIHYGIDQRCYMALRHTDGSQSNGKRKKDVAHTLAGLPIMDKLNRGRLLEKRMCCIAYSCLSPGQRILEVVQVCKSATTV